MTGMTNPVHTMSDPLPAVTPDTQSDSSALSVTTVKPVLVVLTQHPLYSVMSRRVSSGQDACYYNVLKLLYYNLLLLSRYTEECFPIKLLAFDELGLEPKISLQFNGRSSLLFSTFTRFETLFQRSLTGSGCSAR
jgi:hypothetical protein